MHKTSTQFVVGHCYYNANEPSESPRVMLCRKSVLRGLVLVLYSAALIRIPISCDSAEVLSGDWVDCTEQVKRSEAIQNSSLCPLVPISEQYVGTVIAFPTDGRISSPVFLYSYARGMAYLMQLDGSDKVFNERLTHCYPLQQMYKDVAERAVTDDPLSSSMFDGFLKWLGKTPQYNTFVSMVESKSPDDREDMIRLFELMSYDGITADNFEAEVQCRYDALPEQQREDTPKYTAVLNAYRSPAQKYSKMEKEIMRATGFRYKTPQEAWAQVGGGKPFPTNVAQMDIAEPATPHQYVCDRLGLYDGNATGYWLARVCPTLLDFLDMETDYVDGVARYLEQCPAFDDEQLSFIVEEDKEQVFRDILRLNSLDAKDPFRAWVKAPPPEFKARRRENPKLSYVEIFREIYELRKK